MTPDRILILIGILVALSPWSGLPLAWLTWFLLPAGLGIAGLAYTLRTRKPKALSDVAASPSLNT